MREHSAEYNDAVGLMIGAVIMISIMVSIVLCTCGPCIAYNLRRAWKAAGEDEEKKRKKEKKIKRCDTCDPVAKCEHSAKKSEGMSSAVEFSACLCTILVVLRIGWWIQENNQPSDLLPTHANVLASNVLAYLICTAAGVLAVGVYLRRVPDILVRLRKKPHGVVYQKICEQIITEDARRKGKVNDTPLDNNGLDTVSQLALYGAGILTNMLCGSPLPAALLVIVDWVAGKPMLKYTVKYYVKHYYKPAVADSGTIEQLKKATGYKEPGMPKLLRIRKFGDTIHDQLCTCELCTKFMEDHGPGCECGHCKNKNVDQMSDTTVVHAEPRPETDPKITTTSAVTS